MESIQQRAENFKKFGKWDGNILHTIFWNENIRDFLQIMEQKKEVISNCEMWIINNIQHEVSIRKKKEFDPSNITPTMWKITCRYEEMIDKLRQVHSFLQNVASQFGMEQMISAFPDFSITPAIWHEKTIPEKSDSQDALWCTPEVMKLRNYVAAYGTLFQELDALIFYLYREDCRLYHQQVSGKKQKREDFQKRQADFKAAGRWDGTLSSLTFWEKRVKKLLVLTNGGIGIIRMNCDLYFMTALAEENQIRKNIVPDDRTITPAMWGVYYAYEEVIEKIKEAIDYIEPLAKIEKIPELVPVNPDLSISPSFWFEKQVPYPQNGKMMLAPSIAKLYSFIGPDGILEQSYKYLSFYSYLNDIESYRKVQSSKGK